MKFIRQLLLFLIFPFCSTAQNGVYFIPSERQADSVRILLKHTINDTLKMSVFYELSGYYTELNKDTSLYYAELQLQLAKKLRQPLWAANACFQIAYLTFGLGNYPKALNAIEEGLTITDNEKSEKDNWRITTFSGDGSAYKARLFIAAALHQIFAFLYQSTDNIPKALQHFNTAIQLAEKVDNKAELSLDYMSLSGVYSEMGKPDSALSIQNQARRYAIESNYKIYMGFILREIGDIYFSKEQYDSAGTYYRQSLQESIEQYNVRDEIIANLSLSKWARKTGHADSSLLYTRQALRRNQSFKVASIQSRVYNEFFVAFKALNNQDSAFVYLQLAKSLGDSLNNIERIKINQYQSLNLNNQIQLQEAEKSQIRYQNKIRMYGLIAGIVALLTIAILLFRNLRHRKKANELLQSKNEQIEKQKTNIEQTLTNLKATQSQLIQSEKMASLGELTAGIAHEIQNPLNFVNNFSDVNKELLIEMNDEIDKGNLSEVRSIAKDVIDNEEKINHHGKRADAIVKGMLQHSRTSSGQKELTDINALADEYLRLSYHGLRAKDKSFNATIKTDFDDSIGNINIIPQDIGRVLVNLINNAFYAVSERKKQESNGYEPTVTVHT